MKEVMTYKNENLKTSIMYHFCTPFSHIKQSVTNLVHFVEPVLVGGQLSHEGLMFQPFAVEVPGFIV